MPRSPQNTVPAENAALVAYGAMRKAYREPKETGRIVCDQKEIRATRDEIDEAVDLPKYWELKTRTVEKG